ncbi:MULTISPECIES: FecR domain-containing protein [unclassified Lentimonas]|uniref:FecR family protein n=1 Tax=unclassified Lentimonas TaxID=2630993 RepID=UPI0013279DD3|nr:MULTISPECIES: FecR domain-containing protein [unclassified Lentimonas]CAA6697343.1 Unannotated [Lentimonas sp. CC19]CAA6697638.1 Unannotated [Lentimonas sp. CC10]CAA7071199.1 Unannotated [Lentimonas sp. CC11]
MKNTRFHLVLLALFGLSALTINAAQLASAKVLSVTGTVTNTTENGEESPLAVGAILKQGDSVMTTAMSNALLVFSNGSELVVEENSSLTLAELTQEAFSGKKSYEQLQADPSKSQSLLELNYGKVSGHVKKLRPGSEFFVETPLGTAAIRGTNYTVELGYNADRGELLFIVNNKDGKVDIMSRYAGQIEYGRGKVGDKAHDHTAASDKSHAIPPTHTVVVRLSKDNPHFNEIVNRLKNFPPFQNGNTPPVIIEDPIQTNPEAEDVELVSPEA